MWLKWHLKPCLSIPRHNSGDWRSLICAVQQTKWYAATSQTVGTSKINTVLPRPLCVHVMADALDLWASLTVIVTVPLIKVMSVIGVIPFTPHSKHNQNVIFEKNSQKYSVKIFSVVIDWACLWIPKQCILGSVKFVSMYTPAHTFPSKYSKPAGKRWPLLSWSILVNTFCVSLSSALPSSFLM